MRTKLNSENNAIGVEGVCQLEREVEQYQECVFGYTIRLVENKLSDNLIQWCYVNSRELYCWDQQSCEPILFVDLFRDLNWFILKKELQKMY
jgi:hypothetical protein